MPQIVDIFLFISYDEWRNLSAKKYCFTFRWQISFNDDDDRVDYYDCRDYDRDCRDGGHDDHDDGRGGRGDDRIHNDGHDMNYRKNHELIQ